MMSSLFTPMATLLEPRVGERFAVQHYEVSDEDSRRTQIRFCFGHPDDFVPPGKYVRLVDLNARWDSVWMSDTPFEQRSNHSVVSRANGNVLIGGLGLGMILIPIQAKPDVKHVTVVELEQEIIDLVGRQLPLNEKVEIVHGDVLSYIPPKGVLYDTIYFDIWRNVCGDNYESMKKLRRRFGRRLNRDNPCAWLGCWQGDATKRAARE